MKLLTLQPEREWIVCYDIVDDERRQRVAKILEGAGVRQQESVFLVRAKENEMAHLRARVRMVIDLAQDSVRYYIACTRWPRASTLSAAEATSCSEPPFEHFWIV